MLAEYGYSHDRIFGRQAADWVMKLEQAEPDQRERLEFECRAWQAADPRRSRVLDEMRRSGLRSIRPTNRVARPASVALLLVVAAILAGQQLPWNVWTVEYRNSAGEIRDIMLPDGSRVVLGLAGCWCYTTGIQGKGRLNFMHSPKGRLTFLSPPP